MKDFQSTFFWPFFCLLEVKCSVVLTGQVIQLEQEALSVRALLVHSSTLGTTTRKERAARRGSKLAPSQRKTFHHSQFTPSKSPAVKKKARGMEVNHSMLNEMYEQFAAVKALINTRSDSLECKITTLEGKIARISTDLSAVNTKVIQLEQRVVRVEEPVKQIQRQIDDFESHSRRMNLRLRGLPDSMEEVHGQVVKICQRVLPDADKSKLADNIDIVHCVGKRSPSQSGERTRPRGVWFATRTWRDVVWKAAKVCPFLRDNGLQFQEGFPKGVLEWRAKLWPLVKKARNETKRAFYVGGRAFIEGEDEIILPE